MFSAFINAYRDDFRWLLYRLNPEAPVERNVWSVPIEVTLWGDVSDVHKGGGLITTVQVRPDQRFIIKVDVMLHDSFEEGAFRLKLLEALLIEQVIAPYSLNPAEFTLEKVEVPEWILHGFDQLISHRRGGSPSAFYRGFLTSGQMLKPDQIVAVRGADKLEPVDYAIFRASASAMVEALLDQPEGDAGMRSLLGDLGRLDELTARDAYVGRAGEQRLDPGGRVGEECTGDAGRPADRWRLQAAVQRSSRASNTSAVRRPSGSSPKC